VGEVEIPEATQTPGRADDRRNERAPQPSGRSGAPGHRVVCARRCVVKPSVPADEDPRRAGVFVSLHLPDGSLRGCIGTTDPQTNSIEEETVANAISAATSDPRFYPLTQAELPGLDISVDVLAPPRKWTGSKTSTPSASAS